VAELGIFWVNLRDFGHIFVKNLKITPQNTLSYIVARKVELLYKQCKNRFLGGVYIFGLFKTKIPLFSDYENLIRIPA